MPSSTTTDSGVGSSHPPGPSTIAVVGLWHLGCVISACLAETGFQVVAVDPAEQVVGELRNGNAPVAEPGLEQLLADAGRAGRLTFAEPTAASLATADVLWIAFDTPVDEDDVADSEWVLARALDALRVAATGALVIVSSQLPVGSIATLERRLSEQGRDDLRFACIPENLRLGNAIETFRASERFVAGVRGRADRAAVEAVLAPFNANVEWMGVESAEMTKHALNGFLATSVAYINEIAGICESVGADAAEVSRGLKTDRRIGPRSYLNPGDVFAGGTLGRDISFLGELADRDETPAKLIAGVRASNKAHRDWARRTLLALLGADSDQSESLSGRRVAIWGLTYKPGTDTLRRSSALELCRWLLERSAAVRAHDPAVSELPEEGTGIVLCSSALAALDRADALVVCTPWPDYREVLPSEVVATMAHPTVIDAGGFLANTLATVPSLRYARVGTRPA